MKNYPLLIICLLIGAVSAAPFDFNLPKGSSHGETKIPPRQGGLSQPSTKGPKGIIIGPNLVHAQPVKYSGNWAGAVQMNRNITEISGTFTVPNISAPAGSNNQTQHGGSAWLGIDGYTCTNAIFQTGIDWTIQNGKPKYHAWYEWYPEYTHNFNITVKAGDRIDILAMVHNKTGGTAYITNKSTNITVSHTFAGKQPLCQGDAEWIVEDYQTTTSTGTGAIPFAQFSEVVFRNASYCSAEGQHGVTNSTILDMRTNAGKIIATCSTMGPNALQVSYSK